MNDLPQKLEAAIAETERIATRAAQAHKGAAKWTFIRGNEDVEPAVFIGERSLYSEWHGVDYLVPSEVEHIAHNDPDRVLRRVARDRKLLELHRPREITLYLYAFNPDEGDNTVEPVELATCSTCMAEGSNVSSLPSKYCATFRLLAEDYEIEVDS